MAVDNLPLEIFWQGLQELQLVNLKRGQNNIGIPDLIIFTASD